MDSNEDWSDFSDVNYIDWDDIDKGVWHTAENISSLTENHDKHNANAKIAKVTSKADSDSLDINIDTKLVKNDITSECASDDSKEASEWSSDDSRWENNLLVLQNRLRERRLDSILLSSEWKDTNNIDMNEVRRLCKENVFSKSQAFENVSDERDNSRVNHKYSTYDCPESLQYDNEYPFVINTVNQLSDKEYSLSNEEFLSSEDEYIPSKEDIITSDSNSPLEITDSDCTTTPEPKRKRKFSKKSNISSHTSKLPTKKEKLQKKNACRRIDIENFDIEIAKQQSLKENRKRETSYESHSKRLDVLLKSNGLKRDHVPAHGNCFFEAVTKQTKENVTARDLRNRVCDNLLENIDYYSDFLPRNLNFSEEVGLLRQPGAWRNELSDAVPLSMANSLAVTIRIYSSDHEQPVVTISPSLVEIIDSDIITLAYICVPTCEHYESTKTFGSATSSENELEEMRSISDSEEDKADVTIEMVADETTENKILDSSGIEQHSSEEPVKHITPRKQAKYQSPTKKKLTRKQKSNKHTWKKNIRKQKRQSGQEYTSTTGKIVPAKILGIVSCEKCRYKCSSKISEDQRLEIFNSYWNLQSYERQRDFICAHVLVKDSVGSPSKKRKQVARTFTLNIKGQKHRICKNFFSSTLGIGRKTIETALRKKTSIQSPIRDKRGKHLPHNKTPIEDCDIVRRHIESFPALESHYTRKDTSKKYLSTELSIRKMFELYKTECQQNKNKCVKEQTYRNIFCTEYNISFHKPKKDQCMTCNSYNQLQETGNLDEKTKNSYIRHQDRKGRGRLEKQKDKEVAKVKKDFHAVTFDLEAVLSTPCSLVSQVYYKRKLSCYNLSVYSLGDHKGTCYLWNESEGERGSCEVATCLYRYINSLPPYVKHISMFSDNCMGQNRNRYVAAALLYTVSKHNHINVIDQKYLEAGHTQMECDSMHSAIEFAKRKTNIYIPSQWDTVIRMARRNNPYVVVPLKYWDISDFKTIQREQYKNMDTNTEGGKVKWREIVHLQFRKETPDNIYYKYNYDDANFCVIKTKAATRGKQMSIFNHNLPSKYVARLNISAAKKADLLSLCKSGVIPADCMPFYESLPSCKSKHDRLPEPDIQEQDQDSE